MSSMPRHANDDDRSTALPKLLMVSLLMNFVWMSSTAWDYYYQHASVAVATSTTPQAVAHNANTALAPSSSTCWQRPPTVYGLVHMAKTAGTEINGQLANHFERVCGNKGYSYDALESNRRSQHVASHLTQQDRLVEADLGDLYSQCLKGHQNRGRLFPHAQFEIGFDDCDYIAIEGPYRHWETIANRYGPLELHVPCREPLHHLMSQCNFQGHTFDCAADDLEVEISNCILYIKERYSHELLRHDHITTKCFDPMPPHAYVDYMASILQRKRVESNYFSRNSNKPRDKDNECLWQQDAAFHDRVREILIQNYEYYAYCEECLGSDNQLSYSKRL